MILAWHGQYFLVGKTMRQELARRPGRTKHRRPWKRSRNALMRSAADFVFLIQHNQLRVTQYHLYKQKKHCFTQLGFEEAWSSCHTPPYSRLQVCFGLQVGTQMASTPSSFPWNRCRISVSWRKLSLCGLTLVGWLLSFCANLCIRLTPCAFLCSRRSNWTQSDFICPAKRGCPWILPVGCEAVGFLPARHHALYRETVW